MDDISQYPDPASRFQPDGVHGPSQIVDPDRFDWEDGNWQGLSLKDYIIYELHVGTFTEEGTFQAIIPRLEYLKKLGITVIELMPVSQFPGGRNWGYDGVYPFAPQNTYGGPDGLKTLVNECHKKGFSVILDVVYNHLGPEGNYLSNFGPYFTDKYITPWGKAINFDGTYSDEVRKYFIGNALHWIQEYHIDALRIDAIHGIYDFSAAHFLKELAASVQKAGKELGRNVYVIAESDLNDVRVIELPEYGGYGLDAQWNDDFHHALYTLITGDRQGYYKDFGNVNHLVKAFNQGFIYSGQYSMYRKRRHGSVSKNRPPQQFIVFSQNHDQVGNRLAGDRLSSAQSLEKLKLAACTVILSPYIPLLFMGEEYAEIAPFQYFVSHTDEALIEAVRKGRKEEFSSFNWTGEIPDPQSEETFMNSKIDIELRHKKAHSVIFNFYKKLIQLRKEIKTLAVAVRKDITVRSISDKKALVVNIRKEVEIISLYNFNNIDIELPVTFSKGVWKTVLDSSCKKGGERNSLTNEFDSDGKVKSVTMFPFSFIMFEKADNI